MRHMYFVSPLTVWRYATRPIGEREWVPSSHYFQYLYQHSHFSFNAQRPDSQWEFVLELSYDRLWIGPQVSSPKLPLPIPIHSLFPFLKLTECRLHSVRSSVREYIFLVFFRFQKKHNFLRFFEMTLKKRKKSVAKILSSMMLTLLQKRKKVCWMSIEILASKLPDVMGTYRRLSHTVLSCILSYVYTSEQDIWCWWPWLTGADFR